MVEDVLTKNLLRGVIILFWTVIGLPGIVDLIPIGTAFGPGA
jgi:hypothetical protein